MGAYGPNIAAAMCLIVWIACIVAMWRDVLGDEWKFTLRAAVALIFGTAFAIATIVVLTAIAALVLFITGVLHP